MARHRAEHETVMVGCEPAAAADAQHVAIVEFGLSDRAPKLEPLRPFDLDRRHRQEQRSGKIGLAADRGLFERFFGRHFGQPLGQSRRGDGIDADEIDRARHGRFQPVDRESASRCGCRIRPRSACANCPALPAPSDVTTPMPVTTTIGLPNLSDGADMVPPMLRRNSRDDAPSDRHPARSLFLSVSTFPDHAPSALAPIT